MKTRIYAAPAVKGLRVNFKTTTFELNVNDLVKATTCAFVTS